MFKKKSHLKVKKKLALFYSVQIQKGKKKKKKTIIFEGEDKKVKLSEYKVETTNNDISYETAHQCSKRKGDSLFTFG